MVGKTISHYKVLEKIGEGGMGEVYRATDTKLNRDVALKILPEQFASDSQRMGRFQREAEVLASLDHPNIGQIYGIEEAGQTKALVLQLIEGPTLAERIAQGPIPVEEALKIALQIAEGLEAAHEKGVIHRDLKPANIKVNPEGQVKILDFGLAKALEVEVPASSLSQSPTLTNAATQAGVILGTAAYMSPEQARGREVDSRTDVWAFGCVLYEMLTGQPAFEGEDVTVTLARIVEREPNLDALPAAVPSSIQQALRLCLRKDVKRRFSDIRDVRLMLEGEFETAGVAELFSVAQPKWRRVLVSMVMLLLGALIAGTVAWLSTAPPTPQVTRLTITPSPTAPLAIDGLTRDLAISPDGTAVAYVGSSGTSLVVRLMDQNEPAVITGITPRHPVFSPDGESIFFFDGGTLKRVARSGGPVLTLSQGAGASRGASWGPDDRIVFATSDANTGLLRVGSAGGEPEMLTTPDQTQGEVDHLWPEVITDGNAVLFTITTTGGPEQAQVGLLDLRTREKHVLLSGGSHAQYVAPGYLIYGVAGTLWAVAFDLTQQEVVGEAVPVVEGVLTTSLGAVDASISADGTLVYVPEGLRGAQRTLVWVN